MNLLPGYPSYNELDGALKSICPDADANAAEAHGVICGLICAGTKITNEQLLTTICDPLSSHLSKNDELNSHPCLKLLAQLLECTSKKLREFEFDFQLLLPNDDEPLEDRTRALSLWCQGLLIILNSVGLKMASEETNDALRCIKEISILNYTPESFDEDDENSYMELVEYVRMAILFLYDEMSTLRGHGTAKTPLN